MPYADEDENKQIINAYSRARTAALRRLRNAHEQEYQVYLAEEKRKEGIGGDQE